jgi:hypothetical protein
VSGFGSTNTAGVDAANQAEHELAATNGQNAIENKAATPRGLYWFWEKVKTLQQTFQEVITFMKAPVISLFAGVGERILSTNNSGQVQNVFQIESEFVAVPPTLISYGIPGQKAWDGAILYYCVAENTWIKVFALSANVDFADNPVAIPASLTSIGTPGMFSFDQPDNLLYFCVADSVWVVLRPEPKDYVELYTGVPATPASPGTQGQWSVDGTYLYHCVANSTWKRVAFDATWA